MTIPWIPRVLEGPIALPVDVVIMVPTEERGLVDYINGAMGQSKAFWEQAGIRLQPRIMGFPNGLQPEGEYFSGLLHFHHWKTRARTPAVYVWPHQSRIEAGKFLGRAFGNGIAVAAGDVLRPGGSTWLDEIVDHELGHILDLDHTEGSFMAAKLELHNRTILDWQREKMRRAAYRYGGL